MTPATQPAPNDPDDWPGAPGRTDASAGATLHALFEAQAARTPDLVAVVADDDTLTYRELNARANQLAHYLRHHEVGPDTLVGVCTGSSPELAVALLGVLKAGGAYLPLRPRLPREQIVSILEGSGAPLVLTRARYAAMLPEGDAVVVRLDADWPVVADEPRDNLPPSSTPDDLAYVVFENGPVGPRARQVVRHDRLVSAAREITRRYDLTPRDRVLQLAPIDADAAADEIYPTWLAGATVVLRTDRAVGTIAEVLRFAEQEALTILNLPARYWHALVRDLARPEVVLPPSVRLLISGYL